jgi:hypothetical protein
MSCFEFMPTCRTVTKDPTARTRRFDQIPIGKSEFRAAPFTHKCLVPIVWIASTTMATRVAVLLNAKNRPKAEGGKMIRPWDSLR